jgi:uncharacterized membrane protein YuzA (DUF378 family)
MFFNERDLDETAHYYIWLHIVTITLVLVGALNWGSVGLFSYNFVNKIFKSFSVYIYILVGLAALHLAVKRDSYLSFLGWMAFPVSLLKVSQPSNSNVQVDVNVKPGVVKVLYWAANPSKGGKEEIIETPQKAYENTENVGVSQVLDGKATLHFLCPSQYKVGSSLFKRTLEKHVHYRMAYANGWLSDVQTLNVKC